MHLRSIGVTGSLLAAGLVACTPPGSAPPPAARDRAAAARPVTDDVVAADLGVVAVATDDRGRARLLRAAGPAPVAPTAIAAGVASPEAAALAHATRLAPAWRVAAGAVPRLEPAGTIRHGGGHLVRLRQVIDGVDVWGGELRLLLGPAGDLRAASGTMRAGDLPRDRARGPVDDAAAVARALADRFAVAVAPGEVVPVAGPDGRRSDGSRLFRGAPGGGVALELARARRVWHADGDRLVAAWMVEAYAAADPADLDGDAFRALVAAADGRILARADLVAHDAFSYRVFAQPGGDRRPLDGPTESFAPHPTGVPDRSYPLYVAPALVSIEGVDPWLPAGATETVGNNADAYVDLRPPNGLSDGDFRAAVTAPGTFDRAYDLSGAPLAGVDQQMASVTQLFYIGNWLHDFWYEAGFTEAAGNAQHDNYGRGGVEGDRLRLEAQDNAIGGSRNNANMATPSDGLSPRMQIYLWSGRQERSLTVIGDEGAGPATNTAAFGPTSFDATAALVAAVDGSDAPTLACGPIVNDVAGRIGLVDRGTCSFKQKAANLQAAGAVGMVLANNTDGGAPTMGNSQTPAVEITIGSLSVSQADGAALRGRLDGGPVTVRLFRQTGVEADGSLDGTLVAHEFGHYLHHRLSLCGTRMCGALSEGWGDFVALMLAFREGDDPDGVYPITVYASQGLGADPGYFGIRRMPYSVDQDRNALSFRHMADGEALPPQPRAGGGPNSEVHNAGEVWTAMLWDGYMSLQRDLGDFAEARRRMAGYVVTGLLMAPPDATLTETRDAIFAAAYAAHPADHDRLAAAFAGRGAGSCAVGPPRTSTNFVGITESFEVRGRLDLATPLLADTDASCDDDGVLDAGETARVTVPVVNAGAHALTDVQVTLTSPTDGVTIAAVATTFASIDAYGRADAVFDVSLDAGVTGALAGELAVQVTATGGCAGELARTFPLRLNVSDVAGAAAIDRFDAELSVWSLAGDAADLAWSRFDRTPLDRAWRGVDLGSTSDTALVSPPIEVAADEPLVIRFTHRYSFEASDGTLWDGGVIELTTDGGDTWEDVSAWTDPGYTGPLTTQAGNPLGGRLAFSGDSPSYPDTETLTLELGTALAGETIQLRFRIGTDASVGAPGWELDDVELTGIVGTPFPEQVGDDGGGCPVGPGPDAGGGDDDAPGDGDGGGCCSAGGGPDGAAALGGLALLALVGRRRRARS